MDKVLEWAKELQSLAQAGLFYDTMYLIKSVISV